MEYTENYQLPRWVESDRILMEDFNQAMAAIDTGIKAAQDTADKGTAAAETAQDTADRAEGKADAANTTLAALTAGLGTGGSNCRIQWGSYQGSGTYGSGNPTVIACAFKPVAVFLQYETTTNLSLGQYFHILLRDITLAPSGDMQGTGLHITWSDNSVAFYSESNSALQFNSGNYTYRYVAFGCDEA